MSEQQQLHNAGFIHAVSNRQPVTHYMPMQYFSPAPRLDNLGVPQGAAGQQFYFCPTRPQDQAHAMYRTLPPPLVFTVPTNLPEAQLSMVNQEEYGSMPVHPPPYTTHMGYPQLIQNAPSIPTSIPSAPRYNYPYRTSTVKRRPLVVSDPKTKQAIDLESLDSPSEMDSSKVPDKVDEPIEEKTTLIDLKDTEFEEAEYAGPVTTDSVAPNGIVEQITQQSVKVDLEVQPTTHEEDTVLQNGLADLDVYDKAEVGLGSSDSESLVDSDDNDADTFRRMYSREFLLSCKDSPVTKVPPQDLVIVSDFRNFFRMNRGTHRAPQRIIRLPTGLSVKRIEDAFVPSQLRKKDKSATIDPKKALSQEMSVILNRLSASNLMETANEIKQLKLSSPDDIQLLANLTFQKAIRQTKYSKIFAQLCKELKGFEVNGSDPFESLVLRQVQELFNTPLETVLDELRTTINNRIAEAKDEDIKKLLEDDRNTMVAKKTDAYLGNITLLAELYLCRLVTTRTMVDCLKKLKDSQTPEAPTSLILLLNECGPELDQQAKANVDACFVRLNNLVKGGKLPSHQVFKIEELVEFRNRGWKKLTVSQPALPQQNTDIRKPEDKPRWSSMASLDTKRKSIQSTNYVTPSNLAVTQQSYNSRKLKPSIGNWSQGSGLLKSLAEDNVAQSNKPMQIVHQNRSRESSPLVAPRVQGRQSIMPSVTSDRGSQPMKTTEDYETVLKRVDEPATLVLATLLSSEDDPLQPFIQCKPCDRSAMVHAFLEKVIERRLDERNAAGQVIAQLFAKGIVTSEDLISACRQFLPTCDEEWLADVPLGWKNLAEVFHHIIQKEPDNLSTLLQMLKPLAVNNKVAAATVLAYCLRFAADRLGVEYVAQKFHALRLNWIQLGVPENHVSSFVNTHSIQFTITRDPSTWLLQDLTAHMDSSEYVLDLFRRLSTSGVPPNFVRSCTSTLVTSSKDLTRNDIDARVVSLGILVDHNPDRELQVLQGLQECSSTGVPTDQWLKSLLDKKVISSDAFDTWSKSMKGDKSITRNLPMRTS